MYLLTICVVLCPVIAIIFLSSAPNSAAVVAKPDLRLCPAYLVESKPALLAYFLIISATDLSEISKKKDYTEYSNSSLLKSQIQKYSDI